MKSKVVHQSIKSSSLEEKSVTAGRLSKLLDEKQGGPPFWALSLPTVVTYLAAFKQLC